MSLWTKMDTISFFYPPWVLMIFPKSVSFIYYKQGLKKRKQAWRCFQLASGGVSLEVDRGVSLKTLSNIIKIYVSHKKS